MNTAARTTVAVVGTAGETAAASLALGQQGGVVVTLGEGLTLGAGITIKAPTSEEDIEAAYWEMDARIKGYNEWKLRPQSERHAFKAVVRKLLAA